MPKKKITKITPKGTLISRVVVVKGTPGKDGKTPIAGEDYKIPDRGQDGYTPVKGVDYFDGKDGHTPTKNELLALIIPEIPEPIPGKDGRDGIDAKDIPEEKIYKMVEEVVNTIEIPEINMGEDNNGQWFAKDDKKMYIKRVTNIGAGMSTGVYNFVQLLDTPNTYVGQAGKVATVNAGETGLEFTTGSGGAAWGSITGTLSAQTDLQTALNAKQGTISLTTTGTSGAATLIGTTLNIPQYTAGGGGNVSKVGTPANNQLGVWTGDGTIEGDANLTYDGTLLTLTSGRFAFGTPLTFSGSSPGQVWKDSVFGLTFRGYTGSSGYDLVIFDNAGSSILAATTTIIQTVLKDFSIEPTQKYYLDGGSNTYITESSADTIKIFTGGSERLKIDTTTVIATGNISAANLSGTNTGDQTNITGNAGTVTNGVYLTTTQTLTNKRITQRVVTTTDDSTAVIDVDVTDVYELSAVANNTTFTLTGTPTDGQKLIVRYKDAGVSKTLTWTGFTAIGVTLPTSTTVSKWGYVGCTYNSAAGQWHALAVTTQA